MNNLKEPSHIIFERYLIALVAIVSGSTLIYLAIMGPLIQNNIVFKTSPSGIYQTIGNDIINLIFLGPLCIIGGISHIFRKEYSKYILIMLPVYLIYYGLMYAVGMEWSNSQYTGNSQNNFFNYLTLVISGLILIISVLPMFKDDDTPNFNKQSNKYYIVVFIIFLTLFAKLWIDEIILVLMTGDTLNSSYSSAPTLFWLIRILDLGFSIPLGYIGMYLLATRPEKAYPILLLFFGFFVTMVTAVFAMGLSMIYYNDPEFQIEGMIIFVVLLIITYFGYFYLIKDKI